MNVKTTTKSPFSPFLKLTCQLHELIAAGQGDSEEADAIRDEMDRPWFEMTVAERELAGGLSEDLYALRESEPKVVEMSPEERRQFHEEAKRFLGKANAQGNCSSG